MKQVYICEKCGAQYEDYDAAYKCERMHIVPAEPRLYDWHETDDKLVWKAGERCPTELYFPVKDDDWNEESGQYEEVREIAVYRFTGFMKKSASRILFAAYETKREEEQKRWEEECRKRADAAKAEN